MKTLRDAIDELSKKPCTCVPCSFCRGLGTYRADFRTGLPTNEITDGLYELEYCEECHGGIVEVCERCIEMEELYQQLDECEIGANTGC